MTKEFTIQKSDIKKRNKEIEQFTFLPVEKLPNRSSCPINHQDLQHALPRNYDINYVIQLCHILISKIDRYKTCPKDLPFTLTHSLKKLMAFLEVEKDQIK